MPVKRVSDKVVDKSIEDCEFWQVHVSLLLIIITFGLHALGNNPYTYSTTQVNFGCEFFFISGQQQQLLFASELICLQKIVIAELLRLIPHKMVHNYSYA